MSHVTFYAVWEHTLFAFVVAFHGPQAPFGHSFGFLGTLFQVSGSFFYGFGLQVGVRGEQKEIKKHDKTRHGSRHIFVGVFIFIWMFFGRLLSGPSKSFKRLFG